MCGQRGGGRGDLFRWAGGWRKRVLMESSLRALGTEGAATATCPALTRPAQFFYKWGPVLGFLIILFIFIFYFAKLQAFKKYMCQGVDIGNL